MLSALTPARAAGQEYSARTPATEAARRSAQRLVCRLLADISREAVPIAQVLDALATALELSTAETSYLHGLVTPPATPRTKRTGADEVPNEFLLLVCDRGHWDPHTS
jgi:hypothetical protein